MYEQEVVSNGIALLNEHFGGPDWVEQIDADNLNIVSIFHCVCGQIFGDYGQGMKALNLNETQAPLYGFANGAAPPGAVTREWRRQLTEIKVRRRVPAREPVPA